MYLTNYAINKKSPDFKFNESWKKDYVGWIQKESDECF